MKTVELDLSMIRTAEAAHIYTAFLLDFPEYYGKNLDALHDVLTESAEPVCLKVRFADPMPDWQKKFRTVLEDSAEENPSLTLG